MTSTVRLRYTGERETSFMEHGIGAVSGGTEFEVPKAEAERYLRRSDVELALPEASEDSSASQDADTSGSGRSGKRGRSNLSSRSGGSE